MLILGGGALLSLALETGRFPGWLAKTVSFLRVFAPILKTSETAEITGATLLPHRRVLCILFLRPKSWRYRCCSSYLSATRWLRWSECARRARGFGVNRQLGRRPS